MRLLPEPPLTDGVITLRPWQATDAGWYAEQTDDPEIQRFTAEPAGLDPGAVTEAIAAMHDSGSHAGLVITDAVTGELLGNAGLAPGEEPGVGEVSYWVAAPARGRGVATRAIELLSGWAWACGMQRLRLHTHVDNLASRRAAERAGFLRDGPVETRTVKGDAWDIVWFVLHRPS